MIQEQRRLIKGSYIEGSMWAVMVGSAESFALYYAVKNNLPLDRLALLSTLPLFMGACAQWLVPVLTPLYYLRSTKLFHFFIQSIGLFFLAFSTTQKGDAFFTAC